MGQNSGPPIDSNEGKGDVTWMTSARQSFIGKMLVNGKLQTVML